MTVQEEDDHGHTEDTLLSLHDKGPMPPWSVIGFI